MRIFKNLISSADALHMIAALNMFISFSEAASKGPVGIRADDYLAPVPLSETSFCNPRRNLTTIVARKSVAQNTAKTSLLEADMFLSLRADILGVYPNSLAALIIFSCVDSGIFLSSARPLNTIETVLAEYPVIDAISLIVGTRQASFILSHNQF